MAKGQYLSSHQRGIVNRYYANLDSITMSKLQEIVSDLFLAPDAKTREKLWKSARNALLKTGMEPAKVEKLVATGNVESFATAVADLGR